MPEAMAAARPRRWEGWDRAAPIWLLAAAALIGLILLPLGWLAYMSVRSDAGFTLAHYARVLGDPPLQKALWNTVVLAFWSGSNSGLSVEILMLPGVHPSRGRVEHFWI